MYKGEDKVIELLNKERTLEEISSLTNLHIDSVRRIVESLKTRGFVETKIEEKVEYLPTEEFEKYLSGKFPEEEVFEAALDKTPVSKVNKIGIKWAKEKGLIAIEKGIVFPMKSKEDANEIFSKMRSALKNKDKIILEEFIRRKLIKPKITKITYVLRTEKPYSPEHTFDFSVPSSDAPLGKPHFLTEMKNKIKKIMSEMGFEEMDGPLIESSFWNFDALFQPQDHPAREMQDTFYIERNSELPEEQLVEKVKKEHEKSWKYKWQSKEAKKSLLRTHTTALSARYLAKGKRPNRYFAIGKVFRNEAIDYSHLAEFYQVEGIVVWEEATFKDLLGILKEFYKKLGFEKIRFRPSYFPYTEPSLEIEVFFEEKGVWMELGGAGILRPEVSLPLCNHYPVLAWGLSLERPLMLSKNLNDIRDIYKNDLDFLKNIRLDYED